MTAVLAVDGGQSAIRARTSGSSDIVEVDGLSRLEGDVAPLVISAWQALGSPPVHRAVLGLTTAPAAAEAAATLAAEVAGAIGAREVWVYDDTICAHAGALRGGWGVALCAGTGVACLAVPSHPAPPVVVDGDGYLLGDDGAGFWIGREGLRAALRAAAGRGEQTALSGRAVARFGPIPGLAARVHELPRAVNEIAQFAQEVLAAADTDPVASRIVDRAAVALAETAAVAVALAGAGPAVPLALGGRLLEQTELRRRLEGALREVAPNAIVENAAGTPLDGALGLGTGEIPAQRYESAVHRWSKEHDR
ncbi:BadF/BadG/BcrA/BcrD ATPase family protein [Leifsonia sp. H3M29-4]|uniref:BadF/BadG/BcrA/BcrD ATPase family protein n=1 Tax=Salinibacterium metalliresistens TaxID=3031321 RepID=UPI0023DBA02D|nr:BadF/BadG/BcrA/BcrD ATPase family protein [Salinibacterium metalliresistens]MDF1477851.1 BadF/BadG/BcrA/BcrD ATPase family protein [Salinibacterium metalliresistens]